MRNIKQKPIYNLILSALFSAITVLCAWITIPTAVPFTLQTLAVFLMAMLLPLKYSSLSIVIYIALGAVGLPVFSGFQGGIGALLGPTGGYIIGFAFIVGVVGVAKRLFGNKSTVLLLSAAVGLVLCYAFGTLWFMFVSKTDFVSAVVICVLPYTVFDAAKLGLALILQRRLTAGVLK